MNFLAFFPKTINNLQELKAAMTSTYLSNIVIGLICFVLLLIVANAIAYQRGGVDNSWKKRRTGFYVIAFLSLLGTLAFNFFMFYQHISPKVPAFKTKYMATLFIGAFVAAIVYVLISFVVIKFISPKDSKIASIFPRK